jgi:hypothetical protein
MYNPQGVVIMIVAVTQIIEVGREILREFICFKEVKIWRKVKTRMDR